MRFDPPQSSSDVPGQHHVHLTQVELAARWRISRRTLERWRWLKSGPAYLRIGGRIIYQLDDIQKFEVDQRRDPTHRA